MIGYAIIAFVLILWKQHKFSVPFVLASLTILVYLLPYINLTTTQDYEFEGNSFRVAHYNVLGSNILYDQTIQQALATEADLLSFQEVDSTWMNHLIYGLKAEYPYFQMASSPVHGVAVFSKYPVKDFTTYFWGQEPSLTGNIMLPDTTVHFVATHTLSPRSEERYAERNQHLKHMAHYLKSINGPVLAIGDFNAVPWNPYIVQMRRQSNLLDSRKGLTPTYPADWNVGGIPIDYILHSNELRCLGFQSVDMAGSDHKGVLGEYQLAVNAM
uniref:Endonuclease/exonuclease/phosphatase family protein n=1 Tax=Roseihalotalea indica TaxID=2867963 RepID=A0AA49GQ05_9BACT|nr:endonuclease/exonuclease/phosphatase family protein [Tunicatimonas sp. TK19036]